MTCGGFKLHPGGTAHTARPCCLETKRGKARMERIASGILPLCDSRASVRVYSEPSNQRRISDRPTGQLEPLSRAFAPGADPPITSELEPLPPHPSPRQIPLSATALQPWAATAGPAIDLDPAMDEIREFENGWKSACGSLRRFKRAAACDRVGDTGTSEDQAGLAGTRTETRGAREGLHGQRGAGQPSRETTLFPSGPRGRNTDATPLTGPEAAQNGGRRMAECKAATTALLDEEVRRRKQAWRHLVCGDEAYGTVFSAIPQVSRLFPERCIRALPDPPAAYCRSTPATIRRSGSRIEAARKYHSCPVGQTFHPAEILLLASLSPRPQPISPGYIPLHFEIALGEGVLADPSTRPGCRPRCQHPA